MRSIIHARHFLIRKYFGIDKYVTVLDSKIISADWIEKYIEKDDAIVVQIGSNDGVTGDPIYEVVQRNKTWKVLFVEPVSFLFEKLKDNYGPDPRFKFENVAINEGKQETFYWISQEAKEHMPDLPHWYDQLGSFDKGHIFKHFDEELLEHYIQETKITGITLSDLFERHNINNLDLLHIDTEGYDWKILSQLDLAKYSPSIILFEQRHLGVFQKGKSVSFLKNKYNIFQMDGDFLCIQKIKMENKDCLK